MKSGSMRERLTFYELTETQSPSGAIKKRGLPYITAEGFSKEAHLYMIKTA